MADAIIMTVYNRRQHILNATVDAALENCKSGDVKIIVVDDASTVPVRFPSNKNVIVERIDGHPFGTYSINGYNNPSFAFQRGLEVAKYLGCDRTFIISSDVVIPPDALESARASVDASHVVVGSVTDRDSRALWCGPERVWPLYWFMGAQTQMIFDAGGWDLEYMKGIAFEDNDFSARMMIHSGSLVIDGEIMCVHQSHAQTAYSDNLMGWKVNRDYTHRKWGGVNPFEQNGGKCQWTVKIEDSRAFINPVHAEVSR